MQTGILVRYPTHRKKKSILPTLCQLGMCRATSALMVDSGTFVGEMHVRVQSAGLHKLRIDAPGSPQEDKLAFSGDQRHVNYRCWAKMRGSSEGPSSQS